MRLNLINNHQNVLFLYLCLCYHYEDDSNIDITAQIRGPSKKKVTLAACPRPAKISALIRRHPVIHFPLHIPRYSKSVDANRETTDQRAG